MLRLRPFILLILLTFINLTPARADGPALWSFSDEDTKIYLFGTIHALEKGLPWGTPQIKKAFDSADALILEVSEDELIKAGPMMVQAGKLPKGQTLRTVLGNGLYSDISRQIKAAGLPRGAFDQARPWFATLSLGMVTMVKAGFDPSSGADKMLMMMAKEKKKPIYGLETAEIQVGIFADISPDEERIFIIESLTQFQDLKTYFSDMQSAWLAGDVAKLDGLINGSMQTTPELAKRALEDRNRNWTVTLQDNLNTPGTFFVAVGAGHLVGNVSVIKLLEAEGISLTRLQ